METISTGVLLILALVAFNNYKNQSLPVWLKAKFFNQEPGEVRPASLAAGSSITVIPQVAPSSGLGAGLGSMGRPVGGPVTSPYGKRGSEWHPGIDFGVPVGTPVHAARAGKVISAGGFGGYGLKVDLDHGQGVVTRYAHLSRIDARLGETVAAGATVGLSGNTGDSTGPHVHFEVRLNGKDTNPAPYLAGLGTPVSA
jgi:murein DD-endopeptidase MepM/ murein hydrolase activator NlpD